MVHPANSRRPSPRVRLSCSYCKGDGVREELAFCAGCLAPHHSECFAEHGTCSVFGCEEQATILPGAESRQPFTVRGVLLSWVLAMSKTGLRRRAVYALVVVLVGLIASGVASFSASNEFKRYETGWTATTERLEAQVSALLKDCATSEQEAVDLRTQIEGLRLPANEGKAPWIVRQHTTVAALRLQAALNRAEGRFAVFPLTAHGDVAVPEGGTVVVNFGEQEQAEWRVQRIELDHVELVRTSDRAATVLWLNRAGDRGPSLMEQQTSKEALLQAAKSNSGNSYGVEKDANGQLQWVLKSR